MIWCSPLYHGSMSGLMKNTLDWLELLSEATPKYLGGMPVGLAATAGGTQAIQAINSMEYVVRALRGFTVPLVVPVNQAWNGWDSKTESLLRSMGEEVLKAAQALRG
jgi:FMN reductase